MRGFIFPGLLLIALLFQVTLADFIQVANVKPDLIVVLVVLNTFTRGQGQGILWGLGAGFLEDVIAGSYFGMHAIEKMIVGYLAGLARSGLYTDSRIMVAVVTFFVSLLGGLAHYLMLAYVGILISMKIALFKIIFLGAVYNSIVALLLYKWYYHLNDNNRTVEKGYRPSEN